MKYRFVSEDENGVRLREWYYYSWYGDDDANRFITVSRQELEERFFHCEYCDGYYSDYDECDMYDISEIDPDYHYICSDCFDENFARCACCDELCETDDMTWCNETEEYYCDDCRDRLFWCEGHERYEFYENHSYHDVYGDGNYYCDDYCEDHFHWCDGHEEWEGEDTCMWEVNGYYYCDDYCQDHFNWCYGHEEYEDGNDMYEVGGEYYCVDYCNDNFIWCEGYEEFYDQYDTDFYDVDGDGLWYSEEYCEDHFYYCPHCNNYYRDESDVMDDENGGFICTGCAAGRHIDSRVRPRLPRPTVHTYRTVSVNAPGTIRGYHNHSFTDVKSRMLDSDPRREFVHMGYELEVHKKMGYVEDSDPRAVYDIIGDYACFENDASINPGFEIITRPGSLNEHMRRFEDIEKMCDKLVSLGYNSHNSGVCGLHVHIDREYFGKKTDRKLQDLVDAKFLYIFERHWENLVRFSRRSEFRYCKKMPRNIRKYNNLFRQHMYEPLTVGELSKIYKSSCGHGTCVNIYGRDDGSKNTIEIRLWRGSLYPLTIKATLKFTARLAEIVKTKNITEISKMNFKDILGDDEDILAYWETVKDRKLPDGALKEESICA